MKDRFNNPVNDLGNTPAAQAGMDAIAEQADEAIERGDRSSPRLTRSAGRSRRKTRWTSPSIPRTRCRPKASVPRRLPRR